MPKPVHDYEGLLAIMHRLRAPGGCPWDAQQTHDSLRPYLIEEAYEALAAIEGGSDEALRDELGDVLLQVIFHAELAAERGAFAMADVVDRLAAKLVRRHPHVFGAAEAKSAEDVEHRWARIKREERAARGDDGSLLDGIPNGLPALARAHRVGRRAAASGFDWDRPAGARAKIVEELAEVDVAADRGSTTELGQEVGDLLLAAASYARKLGVNPESALRDAIDRFEARVRSVERELAERGLRPEDLDAAELDQAWRRAKAERP